MAVSPRIIIDYLVVFCNKTTNIPVSQEAFKISIKNELRQVKTCATESCNTALSSDIQEDREFIGFKTANVIIIIFKIITKSV